MGLWWALLIVGVLLYTGSTFGTTAAFRNERVPRLGWFPTRDGRQLPAWAWASFALGIACMLTASARLAGYGGSPPYLAFFLVAVVVSWLLSMAVVYLHNRRISRPTA